MVDAKGTFPIVLAHGIARPDYLIDSVVRTLNLSIYDFGLLSDRFHYFRGIASFLRKHGFRVYHSRVSFAADVETRARDLKQEIFRILEETGAPRVHIIAHSMGGLDARYMIVQEDMAPYVASLTTIGTPHFGTPIADYVLSIGMDRLIDAFKLFINFEGISSVTTYNVQRFNELARHQEAINSVVYQTYSSYQDRERVFFIFQKSWDLIYEKEGPNDGLVSVNSQRWVERLIGDDGTVKHIVQREFPFKADHLEQVGWWNLNKMLKVGWWNIFALGERIQHENRIKQVYLDIARGLRNLQSGSGPVVTGKDLESSSSNSAVKTKRSTK
ncbi:MAG: hypothetical protein GXO78_06190 [Calditrichaeota bacterium]|nr:hypothetical protein [Calditrichota bacterium]